MKCNIFNKQSMQKFLLAKLPLDYRYRIMNANFAALQLQCRVLLEKEVVEFEKY